MTPFDKAVMEFSWACSRGASWKSNPGATYMSRIHTAFREIESAYKAVCTYNEAEYKPAEPAAPTEPSKEDLTFSAIWFILNSLYGYGVAVDKPKILNLLRKMESVMRHQEEAKP